MFEWVKQQGYYYSLEEFYGVHEDLETLKARMNNDYTAFAEDDENKKTLKRSSSALSSPSTTDTASYFSPPTSSSARSFVWLEPTFVLLAGAAAAIAYQAVDYPLEQIKTIFYAKETELQAEKNRNPSQPHSQHFNATSMRSGTSISTQIYKMTWDECRAQAGQVGGWRRFLFLNFANTAIRAVPAASVGFLVFEVMKRKLDAKLYESEDREMASYLDRMMIKREAERLAHLKAAIAMERLESQPEYEESRERDFEKQELAAH